MWALRYPYLYKCMYIMRVRELIIKQMIICNFSDNALVKSYKLHQKFDNYIDEIINGVFIM